MNSSAAKHDKQYLGRKPAQLPMTGCHLYQAAAAPQWFPGSMAVYQRQDGQP